MALITEDGTGKADAESLCTLAIATAYHAARGNSAWAASYAEAQEQALRKATDYMQQVYRSLWAGMRATTTQALDWPRSGVERADAGDYYSATAVPAEVQRACAELALLASAGTVLLPTATREVIEQTVGPITQKFAQGSPQAPRFAAVDALLGPLFKAAKGGAQLRLARA